MWFLVALAVVSFAASLFLMPKPKTENARASTLDDLQYPRANEGDVVPLGLGRFRVKGPNTLWVGDFEAVPIKKKQKTGLFSSKKVIVGYQYYVGVQLGLALGPCTLHKIWSAKDELWSGTASADGTAIAVNLPNLYGGKEKGGGFVGTIRFYTGSFTQTVNAYLAGKIGAGLVPGYRGTCYVVLEKCFIGEQNSLRELTFEMSRYSNDLGIPDNKHIIGDDLNPMEVLYQAFTLDWGGLDVNPALLDLDSLRACAVTLYAEGNGMSVNISSPNSGKDIAEEVIRQVDGMMYSDVQTGKIIFKLIRNDYAIEDLPVFDESNVVGVRGFTSKLWDDTINQVRVTYTNRDKKYEKGTAMVQDMANINSQGRVRSVTQSYPGVTEGALATELATRDLAQGSVPLMSVKLELNREGAALRPGDPFVWGWAAYGIGQVVMRVKKFDLGSINDNKIVIECSQDQFAISSTVFAQPNSEGSGVALPNDPAAAATVRMAREGAYFFSLAGGIQLSGTQGVVIVAAEPPTGSAEYDVYTSTNAGVDYSLSEESLLYTPTGTIAGAITASANLSTGIIPSIVVNTTSDEIESVTAAEIAQGYGMFYINGELFAHESVTPGTGSVTLNNVRRALLDTVPQAHSLGDRVWFIAGDNVVDDPLAWDATVRVKLAPKTFQDALDIAAAPYDSVAMKKRAMRPLRPGNIKFDGGTAFAPPASALGAKTITWANRSRLSATIRSIVDATSEYEPGQQTVIRYRKNAGAWVQNTYAPGVTTATIDAGAAGGDTVDWEIYSTRDGLDSFSVWGFTAGAAAATGSNPDTGGSNPTDGNSAYTAPPDSLSIVFPFGETIGTYAIDIPITFAMEIADNFAGSNADVRTNPGDGTATFTVKKSGTTVGTVTITTGGVVTFNTTGTTVSLAAGDTLTIEPPGVEDSLLAGVTITISATRPTNG